MNYIQAVIEIVRTFPRHIARRPDWRKGVFIATAYNFEIRLSCVLSPPTDPESEQGYTIVPTGGDVTYYDIIADDYEVYEFNEYLKEYCADTPDAN